MDRTDRYERLVRSEGYRRERAEKALVIAHLCGDRISGAERVADLGAGTGLIKKELEDRTGGRIFGFELDGSFIEESGRMVRADALRLPVADGAFDFALVNHLYEHVEDQPGLFGEVHRVLSPGGEAYVAAGSRWAVMEPHYRLPFLSWLPRPLADLYLRASGRGEEYRGIRFRSYGPLREMMRSAGFRVEDRTDRALDELMGPVWGRAWGTAWRLYTALLPRGWVHASLRWLSPQWFFRLRKPAAVVSGADAGRTG